MKPCYRPDGKTRDSDYVPCNPLEDESHCCYFADMCNTAGLCFSSHNGGSGHVYRGTCTDPTWASPSCPQSCLADNSTSHPWVNLFTCTASDDGGNHGLWCCAYSNTDCCSRDTFVPSLGTWSPAPDLSTGSQASTTPSSSLTLSSSPTRSSTSQSQTSVETAASELSPPSGSDNKTTIVGAVLGSVLGIVLLAALFLYVRHRQTQRKGEAYPQAEARVAGPYVQRMELDSHLEPPMFELPSSTVRQ